jgi:hypothetical protein
VKLKEALSEILQIPVYWNVPMKSKRPYITLHVVEIQLGQGEFQGQIRMRLKMTVWIDTKKEESQASSIFKSLRSFFPIEIQSQGGEMTFLYLPSLDVIPNKIPVVGYEFSLLGQGIGSEE